MGATGKPRFRANNEPAGPGGAPDRPAGCYTKPGITMPCMWAAQKQGRSQPEEALC